MVPNPPRTTTSGTRDFVPYVLDLLDAHRLEQNRLDAARDHLIALAYRHGVAVDVVNQHLGGAA